MPVKRYCQTLDLKNNPELIAEYREIHSREKAWPEIREGIRSGDGDLHHRQPPVHDCGNTIGF